MAPIFPSSSVLLFEDIPVSFTRTGIWYCVSKHLPDKKDRNLRKFIKVAKVTFQGGTLQQQQKKKEKKLHVRVTQRVAHRGSIKTDSSGFSQMRISFSPFLLVNAMKRV